MSVTESDPAQIERELEATRSRLGGHLDALQNRLSPGQVLDDVMAQLRSNGGAEFGRNLLESVRTNPLPAALTGIGLAWMMAANGRGSTTVTAARHSASLPDPVESDIVARLRTAEFEVRREADEPDDAYDERLTSARAQVLGVARHAQETASSFRARVADAVTAAQNAVAGGVQVARERLGDAGDVLRGVAGSVAESMSSTGESLQGAAGQVGASFAQGRDAIARMMESVAESPVLLGALGVATGAVLGVLLPVTEQERTYLGGVAGQMRDSAASTAEDLAAKGNAVAHAAMQSGREAAEQRRVLQGKSVGGMIDSALSGDLARDAAEVTRAALKAADESARAGVQAHGTNGAA